MAPEFVLKKRIADILASVTLKDKSESWIAVHIEIQSQKDINFAERMYIYNHRIWERFKKEVFSIAVLTDPSLSWRPNRFSRGRWGLSLNMKFPILKLIDYTERREELSSSSNPFAFIVQAYLETQMHLSDSITAYKAARELLRGFFQRGYSKDYAIAMLKFIGAILRMPDALDESFWLEVEKEQGDKAMPYLLPFEKRAMKRGEEIGLEKGEQQGRQGAYLKAIKTFLSTRFGRKNAAPAIEALYGIEDTKALESLLELTCKAKTLDEVLASYPRVKRRSNKSSSLKNKEKSNGSKPKKPSKRKD
ncbi:MAG: Rpn family recombination-promoting nuclease/putative transposase [SAR324 cluster bacterium]|uniref:Rpn family recombination-promoting nuclease/putative transposase n=1 Tax=SAR324 cluster bacterium TaxID=2024889 RepID=A0A7X9FRB0_9DELT|nr:Rpn family recombination-promoting nuclease/putative transposase [SAR324 cluster bacterium]